MKDKGSLMLLAAACIGGGGFIGVKYLLDWGYNPYQITFWRFFFAVLCLSVIYGRHYPKITGREWRVGSILGIFLAACFFLLSVGLQYTTPSINAFLGNTQAVMVPFICWIVFRERPMRRVFLAAGMTFVGVALLSLSGDFDIDVGAVLSLGGAAAFSLQMVFLGRAVVDCDAVHIALVQNVAVMAIAFVVVICTGWNMPPLTLAATGNFVYVGGLCTALYFVLQSVGQRYTSANKTAIIITSECIFAAILSAMIYGERMNVRGYIGGIIIFVAMVLAERPEKERKTGKIVVDRH